MKTVREYASEYREIAKNLGMQGDSTELLVQMLSHFTYTNEVENIAYANEASLERALLGNSKIQHCVEVMYSVFRGRCPRIIYRFRPTKFFDFGVYDKIVGIGNIKLYYLGYLGSGDTGRGLYDASLGETGGLKFNYAPVTIQPSEAGYVTLLCLLATDTIESEFTLSDLNKYYVDIPEEDLSHDLSVKISEINTGSLEFADTTREFHKHLLNDMVFDLTLPGFGSRLYLPESYRIENTKVQTMAFKYTTIDKLNSHDLANIKMDGADPVSIHDTETDIDFMSELEEVSKGVVLIPELPKEDLSTVHYMANKDRYMGSILRSNSDVSDLLKEMYPLKVRSTSYVFDPGVLTKTKTIQSSILKADTVLKGNVTKYVGSGDYHMDVDLDMDTITDLTIYVKDTNVVTPSTTTYSIQSESPISKLGYGNTVYVLKTYLDDDYELATSVIPVEELTSEKLALQYRYGKTGQWITITDGQIPSRPVVVSTDTNEAKTESASKTVETYTSGDNVTTRVTEHTGSSKNFGLNAVTKTETPKTTEPLYLQLVDKSGTSWQTIDSEYLPYISETTTYFGLTDKSYVVPVNGRLEPLIEWPVEIPTVLFVNGVSTKAESYEILSSHKLLNIRVTPDGVVRLLGFRDGIAPTTGEYTAVIKATVSGVGYTCTLKVSTTAVIGSNPRVLELYYKVSDGKYVNLLSNYDVWAGSVIKLKKQDILKLLPVEPDLSKITLGLDCKNDSTTSVISTKNLREKALSDVTMLAYSDVATTVENRSTQTARSLLDESTSVSTKLDQTALYEKENRLLTTSKSLTSAGTVVTSGTVTSSGLTISGRLSDDKKTSTVSTGKLSETTLKKLTNGTTTTTNVSSTTSSSSTTTVSTKGGTTTTITTYRVNPDQGTTTATTTTKTGILGNTNTRTGAGTSISTSTKTFNTGTTSSYTSSVKSGFDSVTSTKTTVETRETTSFGSFSDPVIIPKDQVGQYVLDVPEITLGGVMSTNEVEVTTKSSSGPVLTIYYVPQNSSDLLSDAEKNKFLAERSCYYITDNIQIQRGTLITATLDLRMMLYQNVSMESKISEILDKYRYNFGLDSTLISGTSKTRLQSEIESQIAKLPNVAEITSLVIKYKSEDGEELSVSQVAEMSKSSYFEFSSFITTDLISYT